MMKLNEVTTVFNKLSVRSKLTVFLFLPFVFVAGAMISGSAERYERLADASSMASFAELTTDLAELVRTIQEERSASYSATQVPGKHNPELLSFYRAETDREIYELSIRLEALDPEHQYWGLKTEFMVLVGGLENLTAARTAIDDHT